MCIIDIKMTKDVFSKDTFQSDKKCSRFENIFQWTTFLKINLKFNV